MNIAKASSKLFGAQGFNTIVGFVAIAFFARELGAGRMGVYFLFQATLNILALFSDLGLGGAIEKRISEGQPGDEVLSTGLLMKLILTVPVCLVVLVFEGRVNNYIGADVVILLLVALVLRELAQTLQKVLSGEKRIGKRALPDMARQVVWFGVGGVLVTLGYGVVGMIYGLILGNGVMFLWNWHRSESTLGSPSIESARSLMRFSKYHVVSSAQGYIYSWMDVAIIGFFLTTEAVGAYEIAWRITEAVIVLTNAVAESILPQISEWHADGQKDKIKTLISDATIPSLLLVIPAFGGALVLGSEILGLMFGPEYTIASIVFIVLSGEKILQAFYRLFHRSLHAIDRPDLAARGIIITLALNLVVNLLLIRPFGIEGVAVGTLLSFGVGAFLFWRSLAQTVPVTIPVGELAWCGVATMVMTAVIAGLRTELAVDGLPVLIGLIIFGGGVYFVTLSAYRPLRYRLTRNVRGVVT